jgi:hypothetical protein
MVQLTLENDQVFQLFRQLPAQMRRELLLELASRESRQRDLRTKEAEDRFRHLAKERGLNWEQMDDDQRLEFVDDLVHEDRK